MPTGAPSATGPGVNADAVVPSVFAESAAAFLGIAMPEVGSGAYVVPRLSGNLSAAARSPGEAQEATAASFELLEAKPKRLSARLSVRQEDLALAGVPMFEQSLESNLRMVLSAGTGPANPAG